MNSCRFTHTELKDYMDALAMRYNVPEFIDNDPVQFPRRFSEHHDIEIAALLTATIAWGNRTMILNSSNKLFRLMGNSPFDFVMSDGCKLLEAKQCIHRTFFGKDLNYICKGLKSIYLKHESLEELFNKQNLWQGINTYRQAMSEANDNICTKHISNPEKSACKRIHLALRWLVRQDGIVDLGIWKNIKPCELYIPLDVHVAQTSRALGFLDRKSNDRTAVELLTQKLRLLDPEDPIKYDFALFGGGIESNLKHEHTPQ